MKLIKKGIHFIKRIDSSIYEKMVIKPLVMKNFQKVQVEQFGNEYGGFFAYSPKVNDQFEIKTVLSFGIGEDLSFSEDIMKKFNPNIFAFDPTPKSISFVKQHLLSKNKKFSFSPIGISDKNETEQFHLPVNPSFVSGSIQVHEKVQTEAIVVQMKNLSTICKELKINKIDILKMDIEGSEFKVIPDILNSGIDFDQLCIETHERYFKNGKKLIKEMLNILFNHGYVAIAKNGVEYTFIKKNLISK